MYQGQHQPASNQAPMQQPRINFGMILHPKFGLEQFVEMTKALKCIEDKYLKPQYNRNESSKKGTTQTRRISSLMVQHNQLVK